jgi:hypothetical protein
MVMASKRSSKAIKVAILSGAFLLGVAIINKLDTIVDYFTPDKQQTEEIKKTENKPSLTLTPSPTPEKIFVREKSARELVNYFGSLPSFARGFIIKNSYEGRWVRWKGKVEDVRSIGDSLNLLVLEKDGNYPLTFIISSKECFPKIMATQQGDLIEYEGVIVSGGGSSVTLACGELLPLELNE